MKLYLIKASAGSDYSTYKALTGGPPQNIFAAAAATPQQYSVDMADETIGLMADINSDADLVVIFMSTPEAYRAYDLARRYRKLGKLVILGGLHTKFNQQEAAEHAHSIIVSEVENIWLQLLLDAERGELAPKYQSDTAVDLSTLNPYPTDIISPTLYQNTWSVVVSRGCPFKCAFCLVPKFFKRYSHRPIADIVAEVTHLKSIGVQWVELHSDNLTHDRHYAMALFDALAPLKMQFFGETTILIARDEALLANAANAGFKAVLFGIETPSAAALKGQNKGFIKPDKVAQYVATVKRYGIEVWGDFLFGFDEHDPGIFKQTQAFIKEINIDRVIPHYMIPFPGTETYQRLEQQGRIMTKDWAKYDGSHSLYQPKKMTIDELEQGIYWIWQANSSITERVKYSFRTLF